MSFGKSVPACALALALAGCGAAAQTGGEATPVQVEALPVSLRADRPDQASLKDFRYVGGLALTAPGDPRFGGFSALRLSPDGRLLALSDKGDLLQARLAGDPDGRPVRLQDAALSRLLGMDGAPLGPKHQADAEGLAVWPNGELMVAFEGEHRIWLYPADGGAPRPAPSPQAAMADNRGMEALAPAPSQGPDAYWVGLEPGSVWLCRLSAGCEPSEGQIQPGLGYWVTDLAETPAGDLAVLHRSWDPVRGNRAMVSITRKEAGRPARVIARLALAPPYTVDNFEGFDLQPLPDGGLRITLLSDDNFSPNQRTLLMVFDWTPRGR